jgi:hypothetical protein
MSRLTALVVGGLVLSLAADAGAAIVYGGGSSTTDCMMVFDMPGANKPAPPRAPKLVDCEDGDPTCDDDGTRNGECVFEIGLCVNETGSSRCEPVQVDEVTIEHAEDNGDPRFDVDWQALQLRANSLGFTNDVTDDCSTSSTVTVRLRGPLANQKMKKQKKRMRAVAAGRVANGAATDSDKVKFICRPEGDGVYGPRDLFDGTFDRIAQQVFQASCALSACHDSESQAGGLILLPNSAYGNLVNVAPQNFSASSDGLKRITPGDAALSFLYRKVTGDLAPGYGQTMPLLGGNLSPELTEIIRLWILGDGSTGPASETGWVDGTDQ